MKTKSQILKESHQLAKSFEGHYSACLSEALKITWKKSREIPEKEKIQTIKQTILSGVSSYYQQNGYWDFAEEIILAVEMDTEGFTSDVASTVYKYKRCSEKQVYVIARAFVENDLQTRFNHILYAA